MKNRDMKVRRNTALIVIMIVVAALTRLIPHYPNFTAIGAVALFGGAYLSRRWALIVPLAALFISDLFLNNLIYARQFPDMYDGFVFFGSWPVYAAFIVVILLGMWMLKKVNVPRVVGAGIAGAVVFFVITNFAVWAGGAAYPKTFAGLLAAYTAGIPFFWNSIAGNIFFCAILFGGYEWVQQNYLEKADIKESA